MLLAYGGWTGTVEDKPYNSPRIWATLSPVDAIEEGQPAATRAARPAASIVGSVLFLPVATNSKAPGRLLDAAGRKVTELRPGANDVSRFAPGIYFVRIASGVKRDASAITKLVVTR